MYFSCSPLITFCKLLLYVDSYQQRKEKIAAFVGRGCGNDPDVVVGSGFKKKLEEVFTEEGSRFGLNFKMKNQTLLAIFIGQS